VITPVYDHGGVTVHHGTCLDVLRTMPDASVDAVVCDPQYGLAEHKPATIVSALTAWLGGDREHVPNGPVGFMNMEWDAFVPPPAAWDECLRVLKPGGWLLAFAGARTQDLMGMSIRLAGFEMRDSIAWLYGSGFPKSLDVSKALDKAASVEREVIGVHHRHGGGSAVSGSMSGPLGTASELPMTAPATDAARQWQGWGTGIKPAHEPLIVARRPLIGTGANNVLVHGTGALNIEACRVAYRDDAPSQSEWNTKGKGGEISGHIGQLSQELKNAYARGEISVPAGRWPPNVVLSHVPLMDTGEAAGNACANACVSGCPVIELDQQSGVYGDSGGASRFFPAFQYQAKAPKSERPVVNGKAHPTVKPLALMRWLVRLVTPPGGLILDPFAGTGTTGQAARDEGMQSILIERDADYIPLIVARLNGAKKVNTLDETA
jgi:site-specific DNA-methyltransferase (adenine-specific)